LLLGPKEEGTPFLSKGILDAPWNRNLDGERIPLQF
jgi:hypothetical protein